MIATKGFTKNKETQIKEQSYAKLSDFIEEHNKDNEEIKLSEERIIQRVEKMDMTCIQISEDYIRLIGFFITIIIAFCGTIHLVEVNPNSGWWTFVLFFAVIGIICTGATSIVEIGEIHEYKLKLVEKFAKRYENKSTLLAWNIVHQKDGYTSGREISVDELQMMEKKSFHKHMQRYRNNIKKAIEKENREITKAIKEEQKNNKILRQKTELIAQTKKLRSTIIDQI